MTDTSRMPVAIVGTGNIGTDLMEKIRRSAHLELALFAGVDPASPGIARARSYGIKTSTGSADAVVALEQQIGLVYEATSAAVHRANAPKYAAAGLKVIDLTPAKLGPSVVPAVNIEVAAASNNVNLITCGGQATVPIVAAINSAAPMSYAEIVSAVASESAGPGTRQNIDEFTSTTAGALENVGGAQVGKAIIILNPAVPPILMRNTVRGIIGSDEDQSAVVDAVHRMVETVSRYVPGYRLVAGPEFAEISPGEVEIAVFLEVAGAGDFLPEFAGNLDIMTAAAVAVGEMLAARSASDAAAPRGKVSA
jgi:acetaldehyde dehydrogenase